MEKIAKAIPDIESSDVSGLWEVIRISRENGSETLYPWVGERFKFNFMPEMIFLCLKDGGVFHGSWILSERTISNQKHFSIVLNETFEYKILNCEWDEMTLSDRNSEYLLTRRL